MKDFDFQEIAFLINTLFFSILSSREFNVLEIVIMFLFLFGTGLGISFLISLLYKIEKRRKVKLVVLNVLNVLFYLFNFFMLYSIIVVMPALSN